jgi:hypothetical protein
LDSRQRVQLVEAAIRAPSGDNCQPWQFRFAGNGVEIDLLGERSESFFDFRHRGSLLSIGAVVENIRIQAACLGIDTDISYPAGNGPGMPAAYIRLFDGLEPISSRRGRVAAALTRTVNRRPYLPIRIPIQKQEAWTAEPIEGTEVTIIEDRHAIGRWAWLTYLGDRIRWTHPRIHRELFAKILFTRAEAESKRIGLEIDRLGAGPAAAAIMRYLAPWSRMQRLSRYNIDRLLAAQTRALVHCAGALVLVTIAGHAPAEWIRAGEQVQRLWVIAHEQGLCVQPLPVSMYLDQRFQEEDVLNFMPTHLPLLRNMRSEFASLLGDRIGAMIYRVGYGVRMKHPAVRLPAQSFYAQTDEETRNGY